MKSVSKKMPVSGRPMIKPLYLIVVILLALSGFSQLPLMKRYYISDIPGLALACRFLCNPHHALHCCSSSTVPIGLCCRCVSIG